MVTLTFAEEMAALARTRIPMEDRQETCRDILRRHLASVSLTEVLLMEHQEHKLYCELALRGKRWNHVNRCEDDALEGPFLPRVQLRSLVRDKKGKYQPIRGVKIGPPFQGSRAENRLRDVKGLPRYPTANFEVDPDTGEFRQLVPIDTARLILITHGAHLRQPQYSTRMPAGYSHRSPDGSRPIRVDEWIVGESAFLDQTRPTEQAAAAITINPA